MIEPIPALLPRSWAHSIGWGGWQRRLYPPAARRLAEELAPWTDALAGPLRTLEDFPWPSELHLMRDRLRDVARQTVDLLAAFVDAARSPGDFLGLFRALRRFAPCRRRSMHWPRRSIR